MLRVICSFRQCLSQICFPVRITVIIRDLFTVIFWFENAALFTRFVLGRCRVTSILGSVRELCGFVRRSSQSATKVLRRKAGSPSRFHSSRLLNLICALTNWRFRAIAACFLHADFQTVFWSSIHETVLAAEEQSYGWIINSCVAYYLAFIVLLSDWCMDLSSDVVIWCEIRAFSFKVAVLVCNFPLWSLSEHLDGTKGCGSSSLML